jgi:hypothetical protein
VGKNHIILEKKPVLHAGLENQKNSKHFLGNGKGFWEKVKGKNK